MTETWWVYILRCADGTLYCGVTTDLDRRLAEHNAGKGARYTRARRPVALAAQSPCVGRSAALKIEIAVKRQNRADKLTFLQEMADAGRTP